MIIYGKNQPIINDITVKPHRFPKTYEVNLTDYSHTSIA